MGWKPRTPRRRRNAGVSSDQLTLADVMATTCCPGHTLEPLFFIGLLWRVGGADPDEAALLSRRWFPRLVMITCEWT